MSTRIQHLERIRTFVTRSLARITNATTKQRTSIRRSLEFLDFAMLEASASQALADGLSCVSCVLTSWDQDTVADPTVDGRF